MFSNIVTCETKGVKHFAAARYKDIIWEAHSSVPLSTIYETAMGPLLTSLAAQRSVGSMTEVVRWANITAATSDSFANITHTARSIRIKKVVRAIHMVTQVEEVLDLVPIKEANAPASLPVTQTNDHSVIMESILPHELTVSKMHAVKTWLRLATVIGLMIVIVLIWLFNRWLTRRRLLSQRRVTNEAEIITRAAHEDETITRANREAEIAFRATDWTSETFPTSSGNIGLGISFGVELSCLNILRQKRYHCTRDRGPSTIANER